MKSKRRERAVLYKKWQENHEEAQKKEEMSQDIGIEKEKIVIKKVSTTAHLIELLQDTFFKILRIGFYVCVMFLASLGLTVVLNGSLRELVFHILIGYLR